MDFLTPKSFETLYSGVKGKSDEELVEMMVDNLEIIAGTYQENVENGGQLGSLLLVIGAQMACDGLEIIPDAKKWQYEYDFTGKKFIRVYFYDSRKLLDIEADGLTVKQKKV